MVQTGQASVTYQASGTGGGFITVTFPSPFTNKPRVVVSGDLATGGVGSVSVSNITTTSFLLLSRHNGSGSVGGKVDWIAIDLI